MPNKNELDHMIGEYADWYSLYGDDHRSVGWNKPKHIRRFEALLRFWGHQDAGIVILDLGCGLAHLAEHIDDFHTNLSYIGIDINPDFIEINKSKPST